jgi:hypothetical protein
MENGCISTLGKRVRSHSQILIKFKGSDIVNKANGNTNLFTPCMEFMKAWSKENRKYIERWSTDNGRLAFFVLGEETPREFSLSFVREIYDAKLKKAS